MVYLFWGRDDFSRQKALREMKAGLGDPSLVAMNYAELSGRFSARELEDACRAAPFFLARRLVVAHGLLARLQERRDRPPNQADLEAFQAALASVPESNILVLVEERHDARHPLLKALGDRVEARGFEPPRGEALERWIRQRVERAGGRISPGALSLLAGAVGDNLWGLANEVEKLLLFAEGRPISEGDVHQVIGTLREVSLYRLGEALLQGRAPLAGRYFHQLLRQGMEPPAILGRLANQLRQIALARELLAQGKKPEEMAPLIGTTHPYALKQTVAQARATTAARLEQVYRWLLQTDLAIKTGRWEEGLAVDFLIAALCRG